MTVIYETPPPAANAKRYRVEYWRHTHSQWETWSNHRIWLAAIWAASSAERIYSRVRVIDTRGQS